MSLLPISESDDFVVHYDPMKGMYRVTVFDDGHFWDEYWFDAYEDKELPSMERAMYEYSYAYIKGAAEFMKYMHDYYNEETPIYPSEMDGILKEFLQQYGELKEV